MSQRFGRLILRRLALNLAKLEGSKGSMKGKPKRAGWNDEFLGRPLPQMASHLPPNPDIP